MACWMQEVAKLGVVASNRFCFTSHHTHYR